VAERGADTKGSAKGPEETVGPRPGPRPFLGILFRCCDVYGRIYRTPAGDAYHGRCPKCLRPIRVRVDPDGGIDARFFEVR
jgi:hypothetical protein